MTENTEGAPPKEVVQLAMLMQAKDSRQWGVTSDHGVTYHPTWDEQGEMGREEYLKDAALFVAAMRLLGWGTPEQLESARGIAVQLEQQCAELERRRAVLYAMQAKPARRRLITTERLAVLGIVLAVASLVMLVLP